MISMHSSEQCRGARDTLQFGLVSQFSRRAAGWAAWKGNCCCSKVQWGQGVREAAAGSGVYWRSAAVKRCAQVGGDTVGCCGRGDMCNGFGTIARLRSRSRLLTQVRRREDEEVTCSTAVYPCHLKPYDLKMDEEWP